MHEDIVRFDIPVHDIAAGKHLKRLHNLLEVKHGSLLRKRTLLLHDAVQGATVAVLIDEVEVVGSLEHVDVLDDIGAGLQRGQDVDLIDRALLQLGDLFELFGLDHLDGHFLLGDQVNRLVDLGIDTLAQLLLQLVVLDYLPHHRYYYSTIGSPRNSPNHHDHSGAFYAHSRMGD
jgi:hypothetical protein